MRSLEEIKRINGEYPSERPPGDQPPMYKYVKETFNVPATWWDHAKISLRAWAYVHFGTNGIYLVSKLTGRIRYTSIPVTYEIHASPKRNGSNWRRK